MKFVTCSIMSAGIMAASTAWAAAAPVRVLDYLNLRTGPGINFPIIEIIPAGWAIDAGGCVAGWCQVNVNGIIGYADANFLAFGYAPVVGAPVAVVAPAPVVVPPPAQAYYYPYGAYGDYYYSDYAYGGPAPAPFAGAYAEADANVPVGRVRTNQRPRHATVAQRGPGRDSAVYARASNSVRVPRGERGPE